jgi:hypothetical protein
MDINSVLLVAGICIVIGFLLGGMLSSMRKEPGSGSSDHQSSVSLKAWYEPKDNELIVELNGKEYERSAKITPKQRNQINQIILKLNDWLAYIPIQKQKDGLASTPQTTSQAPVASETVKPRLSLNPVNMLANALKADVPISQLPTESIVTQIDDILQEKLNNSPLSGEPIRLMEWPNIGMVVMIGLDQYESVDVIPNEEIKNLIRSAVAEWEQRGLDNP